MKKRKNLVKVFSFLCVLMVLWSCFAIFSSAAEAPEEYILETEGYTTTFSEVNTTYTVLTSKNQAYTAYFDQRSGVPRTIATFETPLVLDPRSTYFIFTFVLDDGGLDISNFTRNFCVFDYGSVFERGYKGTVSNLGLVDSNNNILSNGGTCFYNVTSTGNDARTISKLACRVDKTMSTPMVFLSLIVKFNDDGRYYIGQDGQLIFNEPLFLKCYDASYTFNQLATLTTLQNNTVYNYDEGYRAAEKYFTAVVVPNAQNKSYIQGVANGERQGYLNGYADAETVSRALIAKAFEEGKAEGISQGGDGNADTLNFSGLIYKVCETPFNVLRSTFNFELLGVNIATFIFSLITLFAVIKVVRMVL